MKSKRTLATSISNEVRQRVRDRDKWCIFCGQGQSLTVAHYIPRSGGGLGIEENLALACITCHQYLDFTVHRSQMMRHFQAHLKKHYPGWEKKELRFKKYEDSR